MGILESYTPGQVLDQINLGDYIASMGMGVAQAQKALDDNSLNQLALLAKPQEGLNGKSLLTLGFVPTFYYFRSATLSCSINISLRVTESVSVGLEFGMGGNRAVEKGPIKATRTINKKNESATYKGRTITIREASSMSDICKVSEENSSQEEQFIAERNAVANKSKFTATADSLATYNAEASVFVVPPSGKRWMVIKITAAGKKDDEFKLLKDQPFKIADGNTSTTDSTNKLAEWLLSEATTGGNASKVMGYILGTEHKDLTKVLFKHDSYKIETIDSKDYAAQLRALVKILNAASVQTIKVEGYTDRTGSTEYNVKLSELRAKAVREILLANEYTETSSTSNTIGKGETNEYTKNDADGKENAAARCVDITVSSSSDYYIYLEEITEGTLNNNPTVPNSAGSIIKNEKYPSTLAVSYGGSSLAPSQQTAASLATTIQTTESTDCSAEAIGELVYLTNKSSNIATIHVFAKDGSSLTETTDTAWTFDKSSSSSSTVIEDPGKKVNTSSAFALSVDARYSRMFDMSMNGNMSITAELVSAPPPQKLLDFIQGKEG